MVTEIEDRTLPRTSRFTIRFNEPDADLIRKLASKKKVLPITFIRETLLATIKKKGRDE